MQNFISKVQPAFNRVVQYSEYLHQDTTMHTEEIFRKWAKNKEKICKYVLNRQLILEMPYQEYMLSHNERTELLNNFVKEIRENGDDKLANFVHYNSNCFFEGLTDSEYKIPGTGEVVPKKTKIIKDFKYFIEGWSLSYYQNEASKIIQKSKISGILCMSIHPLDYLSISENTNKWRSCHALDGEYCGGNIEYMADSSTIVCYLKPDNEEHYLPNFPDDVPWNSKAWRVLLFTDPTCSHFILGKEYPFENPALRDALVQLLPKKLDPWGFLNQNIWTSTYNTAYIPIENEDRAAGSMFLPGHYLVSDSNLYNIKKDFMSLIDNHKFYFDIESSSDEFFHPRYYGRRNFKDLKKQKMQIGADIGCVCCGTADLITSSSFLCKECLLNLSDKKCCDILYCERCGNRILEGDEREDEHERVICDDCYNDLFKRCSQCGDYCSRENNFSYEDDVCNECYNSMRDIELPF